MSKVILKSCDGEEFEVERVVASESMTLKHLLEDSAIDPEIPTPDITGKTLAKVIDYCKYHVDARDENNANIAPTDEEVKKWNSEFVRIDEDSLGHLILAADYLHIQGLLDLTTKALADVIWRMSPEDIRKEFNIKSDFSPEELELMEKEKQWLFD